MCVKLLLQLFFMIFQDMDGIPLKRRQPDDQGLVDIAKCIICQTTTTNNTTSTENGRQRITDAAAIRKDIVTQRIRTVDENFVYHMTNECYKKYTLNTTLKAISEQENRNENEGRCSSPCSRKSRSKISARFPPSNYDVDVYQIDCVICGNKSKDRDYNKHRISEHERARKFLEAAIYFQDEVYTRTCDLQSTDALFGADLYCHKKCVRYYLRQYEYKTSDKKEPSLKMKIFNNILVDVNFGLHQGQGFTLSGIRDRCNHQLTLHATDTEAKEFTNREIKVLLVHKYEDSISFTLPSTANKSSVVFLEKFTKEEMVETISRGTNTMIQQCASAIRQDLLNADFHLQDKFCDSHDLQDSWKNHSIPESIVTFLSTLFNCKPAVLGEQCLHNDENKDENDINSDEESETCPENTKAKKLKALYQIMYYIVHNGKRRTPLHIMNAEAVHAVCKSKTLVTSLSHFGLAISYPELVRYHNDMASYILEVSADNVPLPSHFVKERFTIGAVDNWDHEEDTQSGISGSHDTVLILIQENSDKPNKKPNISETEVIHGEKQLKHELPCQQQQAFIKVKNTPLPENFTPGELPIFDDHEEIHKKDMVWGLSRIDLSDLLNITPVCTEQDMPSWSSFNSVITDERLPTKTVGFLPVIPHPVTEYSTVYTAMKNFQNIQSQLDQSHMPIFCDEGVYHIARDIQLQHPNEFDDVVLCIGSFHMMKVVLACIGKYLDGSGAVKIWTENDIFGLNVVNSVLSGSHYVRSLKGMMLLCECIERLQWVEFLTDRGNQYDNDLQCIQELKKAVASKDRDESKRVLQCFLDNPIILEDFVSFKSSQSRKSETFAYWDHFVEMVYLLRDLIRADREGNWRLHLHTLKSLMSLFAVCDRTNYLRWASLYLEDMMLIETAAPDVHQKFMQGEFVVKRTPGLFKAIGPDLCLEQTINRSQKSSGGIIGRSKQKEYVTQWELIYHEMLAVSNMYRELSGVQLCHSELALSHEFTISEITNTELHIGDMITYILKHENPAVVSSLTVGKLHNILTQQIMTDGIRQSLLNMKSTGTELYTQFRKDRYIQKIVKISATIHRYRLKTFKDINGEEKTAAAKKKDVKKELSEAQKLIDLARVRDYDIKKLLEYDLVSTNYLFDEKGFMTDPHKSTLLTELETKLVQTDYILPKDWNPMRCTCVVDVMANIRRTNTKNVKSFKEFLDTFLTSVLSLCRHASRIDFVFDSYIEGSVKDSERLRRSDHKPIEIANLTLLTPMPKDLTTFWSSNSNKMKLQLLLRNYIIENEELKMSGIQFVLSGCTSDDTAVNPCQMMSGHQIVDIEELELRHIEEADLRIIPHVQHATQNSADRCVILSNDTDIAVLNIHYWQNFKRQGLKELWFRAGVGDKTRYVPIHVLASRLGQDVCKVLLALHILTGSDTTSKFGTTKICPER